MRSQTPEKKSAATSPDPDGFGSAAMFALAAKTDCDDPAVWLPLTFHLADTVAVMKYLVNDWLPARYCERLGLDIQSFFALASAAAAFHDVGKSIKLFQNMITEHRPELRRRLQGFGLNTEFDANTADGARVPHGTAGAEILRAENFCESFAAVVGAHHGMTENDGDVPELCRQSPSCFGWRGDGDRNTAWGKVQRRLIAWAGEQVGMADKPCEFSRAAQMALTGLVIMADWIASNTAYFPLIPIEQMPREYDCDRPRRAFKKLDLPKPWNIAEDWRSPGFFMRRFGFEANDVQKRAARAAAQMKTPGIMILEAPMGVGKTEAALSAAEILMNRFGLGGTAFFLPSQATSNAMFTRMTRWAENQPDAVKIAVELIHGQSEFNREFKNLEQGRVHIAQGESARDVLTVHSFFRGRKTRLLANLTVGTVDQLLMAALKRRHVMLRHLGLTDKVVIIDECHAYDAYMNTYLDRALEWLGAYKIPVILLSATLPGARRADFLNAYLIGRAHGGQPDLRLPQEMQPQAEPPQACPSRAAQPQSAQPQAVQSSPKQVAAEQAYPLLSLTENDKIYIDPIVSVGAARQIKIKKVEREQAIDAAERVLARGCVGIIVNTVKRAQELRDILSQRLPNAVILIDHSQFLAPDRSAHEIEILERVGKRSTEQTRAGVLVIGTQVLEQSLDLDFDLLITDLCPMDLLLQRIGRLHRHPRKRPCGAEQAQCLVMGAQEEPDDGSRAVYGDYLLIRTRELLPQTISLPDDISPLVQKTYDRKLWTPPRSPQYESAQRKYDLEQKSKKQRAQGWLLGEPYTCFNDSIKGMLNNARGLSDPQARAAVRDGDPSVEVLVVRRTDDGYAQLLSGEKKGAQYRMDSQPDAEQARAIAEQRLRLPACFLKGARADRVIAQLEKCGERLLPLWLQAPMLEGELFLILDSNGSAELDGCTLHYDSQVGLIKEEEKHGAN